MTQQLATQEARYREAFDALQGNGVAQDPNWARVLREAALARFMELGFPVTRRGNEEWKYTNIGPIARHPFQAVATSPDRLTLKGKEFEELSFGQRHWNRLVFVDGRYAPRLSSPSAIANGVTVISLAEGMGTKAELVERHLARQAHYEGNAFTALNTAFVHDGALVHIPDNTIVEEPIHLLFLFTPLGQETFSHPRVLILVGRDSKATIIESYEGLSDGPYFTNAVTEIVVGAGAAVAYYKMQRQSEQAFHITNTHAVLARDSSFSSVNIDLGGGLVRNNLNLLMGEDGCSCALNGLYLTGGSQHVDNQVIIDHAKPYTTSRELYKGILNGRSRTVFHGSIIVREGAKKVDARQEDRNLLLSDEAEADTKPAFWIYADDVRCAHGAACGQIDEKALFYLRSRGLAEKSARNLLVRGFVSEVIDGIRSEPVRARVDELVQERLQEWLEKTGEPTPRRGS